MKRKPIDIDMVRLMDRPLPQDTESESALLGSLMHDDGKGIGDVIPIIRGPDDFMHPRHRPVWDALIDLYQRKQPVNVVTVHGLLRDRNLLEPAGGRDYLEELVEAMPHGVGAEGYARSVRNKGRQRRIVQALAVACDTASEAREDIDALADEVERLVFDGCEERRGKNARHVGKIATELYDQIAEGEATKGIPTGFSDLDAILHGLKPGELITLAARPSMGKSALMLNMARNIARCNMPVAVLSLEMNDTPLVKRLLSSITGISGDDFEQRRLGKDGFLRLAEASGDLHDVPIFIDDSRDVTLMQIRSKARWLSARHGMRVLFIDYLQLISVPGAENRVQEVAQISRTLKAVAHELDVAVVALSQLNRQAETREDHRPRLSDLRDSGAIEQDSDVVLMLHREDYYKRHDEHYDSDGQAELIVAKNRNGRIGTVVLKFDGATSSFRSRDAA